MSNPRGKVLNDAEKLYRMLQPGPKFLIARQRQLVRHGELMYFSVNTMSKKPRYFWLFNDCLLITKRMGVQKFQLQVVIHFSSGMKVVTMPDSPNHEFRLLCPEKVRPRPLLLVCVCVCVCVCECACVRVRE
jgi:hypothetical protein